MKKTSRLEREPGGTGEREPEYRFDYSKAKPNRFVDRARPRSVAVMLDPDGARVFKDAESLAPDD